MWRVMAPRISAYIRNTILFIATQKMTEAKNEQSDEGFRRAMTKLKLDIRSETTRERKAFEGYALKTMAVLDRFSRQPHISRGFPVDSTNNISESGHHALKSTLGYRYCTIQEIFTGGISLMDKQRDRVHE